MPNPSTPAIYRLPAALAALAGTEVQGVIVRTGVSVGTGSNPVLLTTVDGIGQITIPLQAVTPTNPFPEPPIGTPVLARLIDQNEPWVFIHLAVTGRVGWYPAGLDECYPWSVLIDPVALIPDRHALADTAPAPTFPWTATIDDGEVSIRLHRRGHVRIGVGGLASFTLTAADVATVGRALIAAAGLCIDDGQATP